MNNKYLCLVLISILVVVPLSTVSVKATNEGSYRYGFSQAVSDYNDCYTEWSSDDEGCAIGSSEPISECYVGAGPGNVTNQTACTDDYMHGWAHFCKTNAKECVELTTDNLFPGSLTKKVKGWEHWCTKNAKECAELITSDIFPGSLTTDNKTALASAKALSYIVGAWDFVNKTKGLSTSVGTIIFLGGSYTVQGGSDSNYIQIINGVIVQGQGTIDNSGVCLTGKN